MAVVEQIIAHIQLELLEQNRHVAHRWPIRLGLALDHIVPPSGLYQAGDRSIADRLLQPQQWMS
jgi:hypothetical protein